MAFPLFTTLQRFCHRTRIVGCSFFVVSLLSASCSRESVPGGQVTIRNDLQDKSFTSFTIDQISTKQGSKVFARALQPGQQVTLPYKDLRQFRLVRPYGDYSRVYVVQCPSGFDEKVTMKLIDIHTDKIAGGCALAKYGKLKNGFVKWE